MGEAFAAGDIQDACKRAMQLSYINLRYEKANLVCERNSEKQSLEAVGILKKAMDMEDRYLIYKINNSQFNDDPDYMFRSSHPMAQISVDMDQERPKNPLPGEKAYFDGYHLQCIGY